MTRRLATQRLSTTHDTNGNPRRLTAVYDLDNAGDIIALYDGGYAGERAALAGMTAGERAALIELPEWTITPGEYAASKREAREAGTLR